MASFFQLLRDRILNRAFIILPRPSAVNEDNQDDKSASGESEDEYQDFASEIDDPGSTEQELNPIVPCESSASLQSGKDDKTEKSTSMTESKRLKIDMESFYANLKSSNSLETRCDSVINLAICLSKDLPDVEISDCLSVLKYLSDSSNYPHLAVCHGLLLCAFTRMSVSMSLAELGLLEERILTLAESLKKKDLSNRPDMYRVEVLSEHHSEITITLCNELFGENYLVLNDIDISTICCSSLNNLSTFIKQHDRELGSTYTYKKSTIKYILGMTGKSTQEIMSENVNTSFQKHCPSISCYRIKLCLQVLEHALSIDPELSYCESLNHESFSLPHCLTRLLGWSASHVFPAKSTSTGNNENCDLYFKFHHSTLVCILKILSVLTFNPDMYDTYANVKGLMEKILICALKAYFETDNNYFDVQVLCLEMLINLYIKNQKTFIVLCLKKFRISETEEVLAVEALIKMLFDNLEKIKEVKGAAQVQNDNESAAEENKNDVKCDTSNLEDDNSKIKEGHQQDPVKKESKEASTTPDSEEVLQAASKDMEHSTIVSFICVLLVFFMRTKQNFKEFILERLTSEVLREATIVSQKFLEFASLTGGMPVTGILILSQTIKKLQQIQSKQ